MVKLKSDPNDLAAVRHMLIERFDLDELRDLSFTLGIDYADFPQWRAGMARELVVYLAQHNAIPALMDKIQQLRPDIKILDYLQNQPGTTVEKPPVGVKTFDVNTVSLMWSKILGSPPCSEPIVLGQVLLVPLKTAQVRGSVLRAMTLRQGHTLWEKCFEDVTISGFTKIRDDLVVLSLSQIDLYDGEGFLVEVDARGRIIWQSKSGALQVSAPAYVDLLSAMTTGNSAFAQSSPGYPLSIVAFTSDNQWLEVLDGDSGEMVVEVNLSAEASVNAPAIGQNAIYIAGLAPTVLAVGLDGELLWRFDAPVLSSVQMNSALCAIGSLLIFSTSNGDIFALHSHDGSIAWEAHIIKYQMILTGPVTDGTRVYFGTGNGVLALQVVNGHEAWYSSTVKSVMTTPVIWNDLVVIISGDHCVYALDRHTGQSKWEIQLADESYFAPAIVDGDDQGPYLVVVDNSGQAFTYQIPTSATMHETAGRWHKAAIVWELQGRLRRAAVAWIRHARHLMKLGHALASCAPAWQNAERLFRSVSDFDKAANCRREYARSLGLPLISLEVEHKGLEVNTWSLLNFNVTNEGYGLARHLVIQTQGTLFDGQVAMTQALSHLPPGRSRYRRLDVKPFESGAAVPLRVEVSYIDENDCFYSQDETIYLQVGRNDTKGLPGILPILRQPEGFSLKQDMQRTAVEVEIRISPGTTDYHVEVSLDDGHVFSGGHLPKSIALWQPGGNPTEDGHYLFNQLFSDPVVEEAWRIAQVEASAQSLPRRIRLRIGTDVPELHVLPWEIMYDGIGHLSANPQTPFSRYYPVPKAWGQPLMSHPIRVLGVISNPRDLRDRYQLNNLDVDLEKYILATAFKGLEQGKIRLDFLPSPVTVESLSYVLRRGYQIVHFVGHGRFLNQSKRTELIMENGDGNGHPVSEQVLGQIFSHADIQPHLVYLSACQSSSQSSRDAFVGMGPSLVQAGVPAVIGMQDRVSVATARRITQMFYRRLTEHGYVDQALNEARAGLVLSDPAAIQTPVLFMRLPSGRLWDLSL
ncbi:MAG: CHAT domain-containing protein [Anaerolineae bacterium]|nr:CHAT domain-containing protein [Anaerolineae bacterium]